MYQEDHTYVQYESCVYYEFIVSTVHSKFLKRMKNKKNIYVVGFFYHFFQFKILGK